MARFSKSIEDPDSRYEAVVYLKPGMNSEAGDAIDLVLRVYPLPAVAVMAEFTFTFEDKGSESALHRAEQAVAAITPEDVTDLVTKDEVFRDLIFG